MTIPLSILDLAPIPPGETPSSSIAASVALAQRAEEHGYRRVWYAEHHNMPRIASSAPAVLIAHIGAQTSRIRLGSGGVMLPNHAPLVIAEQYGALDAMYPGRIDLGVGRAPGSDRNTMYALRRDPSSAERFPQDVLELQGYLMGESRVPGVNAIPGKGSNVPIYMLGSSTFGAKLAAALGLPYAFASHFAPAALVPAIQVYRERFQPSAQLDQPYVMLAANVIIADTDEAARKLATSQQKSFIDGAFRRKRTLLQPPIDNIDDYWHPQEKAQLESMLSCSFIGSIETVQEQVTGFIAEHQPDELIVATSTFDQQARLGSLERLASLTDAAVRA
jgi:luciferase family oxidoreductase group 1